jgi:hypothetical protein
MKFFSCILLVVFSVSIVFAKPVSRSGLKIERIHPMSVDRTHCGVKCSSLTRFYVNKGSWGDTNCRTDAADLLKEDSHIYSLLLIIWASGKKVRIEVDD